MKLHIFKNQLLLEWNRKKRTAYEYEQDKTFICPSSEGLVEKKGKTISFHAWVKEHGRIDLKKFSIRDWKIGQKILP